MSEDGEIFLHHELEQGKEDMLRMNPYYVTEECRGHVVEITYAQGILQMETKVPRDEDLEFSWIHLPTCLYNKYLLSIHPTLGLEIK